MDRRYKMYPQYKYCVSYPSRSKTEVEKFKLHKQECYNKLEIAVSWNYSEPREIKQTAWVASVLLSYKSPYRRRFDSTKYRIYLQDEETLTYFLLFAT